ncbi:MAG: hypothetical protein IMF12_11325, partial [Proteobacteria bacterium]|nr:hypothetical protein [Pseudomonadota bacterium]
ECKDIEDYFVYGINGEIFPNPNKNEENIPKAEYMVETVLDLNHSTLKKMREEQYLIIVEQEKNGIDIEELLSPNYNLLPPFYTMLKQIFL